MGGWAALGAAVGLGEVGGVVCAVYIVSRLEGVVVSWMSFVVMDVCLDVLCPRLRESGS